MKLRDAVRLAEINTDNISEARKAITELKRSYAVSSKALERHGYEPKQLRETRERIQQNPLLYKEKIKDLNVNQLREVYSTYKKYFYSEQYGFKKSTVKDYKQLLKEQERILGIKGYSSKRWSEDQRTQLWNLIEEVRNLGSEFFIKQGISPDFLYSSGRSIREIAVMINNENITDPVELLSRLRNQIDETYSNTSEEFEEFF